MRILLIFICIVFVSCSSKQNEIKNTQSYIIDINKASVEDQLLYSTVFGKMKTIILETSDEALISMINKMEVYKDYIIILDYYSAKSIFVFDKEGKFIRKIGAIGAGPGEYISPHDFTINSKNGEIYILDFSSQKVLRYNITSGEYLSTINMRGKDRSSIFKICYTDDILYTDAAFSYESSYNYLMQAVNPSSGEQEDRYFTTEYTNKGWYDIYTINSKTFYYTGKRLLFNQFFMDTVISLTPQIQPFIIIKSKDLVTRNDIEKFVNTDYNDQMGINKIRHLTNFIEHNDFIFFHYTKGPFRKNILYNIKNEKACEYKYITNDFIFKTREYIIPNIGCVVSEGLYTYYDRYGIDELIFSANNGWCSDMLDKKEELAKLSKDTNPIIFYFEYKD